MRTKALVLTAALTAAGIATSMAQVYSVNAVGYVNQTIPVGYSMVANPLVAQTNTLNALLPTTSVPLNLTVFRYDGTGYSVFVNDEVDGWLQGPTPVGDTATINFGDGVFLLSPTQFTLTWVGEVAQGTPIVNPIPAGYSIKSSKVPQSGKIQTDLAYVPTINDTVFKFDTVAQGYKVYVFDEVDGWLLGSVLEEPSLGIAEAVFFLKAAPSTWNRNFTVN